MNTGSLRFARTADDAFRGASYACAITQFKQRGHWIGTYMACAALVALAGLALLIQASRG